MWFGFIASAVIVLAALIFAPWRSFFSVSHRVLLWLAYSSIMGFVWLLKVELSAVIAVHLSMMSAAVFLFGLPLAIIAGVFGLVAVQLVMAIDLHNLGLNFLLSVAYPVFGAIIALQVVTRIPFNNLFVFILGGGFFGAVFTVIFTVINAYAIFWIFNAWSLEVILEDHFWLYGMSLFPEGFINGATISTITVLWPDLVKSYDDKRYLGD
ncbi:hypothetical protein [Sessilibacter sp. MAH2]